MWQPIETAPKDGTWFVTCNTNDPDEIEAGCYSATEWQSFKKVEGTDFYQRVSQVVSEWRGFNNFHRATHWMPLPPPPTAAPDHPSNTNTPPPGSSETG